MAGSICKNCLFPLWQLETATFFEVFLATDEPPPSPFDSRFWLLAAVAQLNDFGLACSESRNSSLTEGCSMKMGRAPLPHHKTIKPYKTCGDDRALHPASRRVKHDWEASVVDFTSEDNTATVFKFSWSLARLGRALLGDFRNRWPRRISVKLV